MSQTIRLKHLCSRWGEYGLGIPAESYVTDGIRLIRTSDITDDGKLAPPEEGVFVDPTLVNGMELRSGDVLISRSGTVGRSLLFDEDKHGPCTFAAYLVRFRVKDGVDPRFIYYFTKSLRFEQQIRLDETQATIANFNAQKLGNLEVPLHSAQALREIADFLDRETAYIEALAARRTALMELVDERRQALISSAVTQGIAMWEGRPASSGYP